MLRKILITGLGILLMVGASLVAYADAKYPQSGGDNLLQSSMQPDNGRAERVKGISVPLDTVNVPMVASAKRALAFASRGRDNLFVINHGTGSGSGSRSGTGSRSNGSGSKGHNQSQVAEPYALLLFGSGLAGVAATLRRRRRSR